MEEGGGVKFHICVDRILKFRLFRPRNFKEYFKQCSEASSPFLSTVHK